jgi:putative Mg2+ transporter-C (MgtC) family protein
VSTADIIVRLLAATAAGGVLGLNRKLRGKSAGLRTHCLVSLGSALAVLTADLVSNNSPHPDPTAVTRAIQGIVAGIGFLGAGAILKSGAPDSTEVRGLTTAATLWLAATLGMACGAGYWIPAVVAVVLALIVLVVGGPLESSVRRNVGDRWPNKRDEPVEPPSDGGREE